jgi:PRTRC genetic system protein B
VNDSDYILDKAFFVYKRNSHNHVFFFQEHKIGFKNGKPILLEGRPLTKEAIIELCSKALPSFNNEVSYLNDNVIATSGMFHGPDVWWAPPKRRAMFFSENLKIHNKIVPWPGLVLVAHEESLDVYAVKGDIKPKQDTRLYVAPFLNMDMDNESICLGNSPTPKRSNDYEGWEKALFESKFSEESGDKRIKKGSLVELFRGLSSEKVFPYEQLIPSEYPKTVSDLLEKLNGRG